MFESGYYGIEPDEQITIIDQLALIDVNNMKLRQGFSVPIGQQVRVNRSIRVARLLKFSM